MKTRFSPIKVVLSLGWLGLVILLLAASIFWALSNQFSAPYDAIQERMQVLDVLEGEVQQTLNQMKLDEARIIFGLQYGLEGDQDHARLAEESDAQISASLQALADDGHFTADAESYIGDISAELKAFNELRSTHRQTVAQAIAAYQADDLLQGSALVEKLQEENAALETALNKLIALVEQDRMQAHRDFPEDINQSIYIATGGIAFTLLLALAGYQLISSAVRPLKSIHNTITAITGDQYRPEMQAQWLKRRGPAGELVRALDRLARGIQQRDAGLKAEIERLREALYESRRRRLKVQHGKIHRSDPS